MVEDRLALAVDASGPPPGASGSPATDPAVWGRFTYPSGTRRWVGGAMGARCTIDSPIEETVAYAEGALAPDEQARIEAHLPGCVTCQQRLVTFAQVDQLLREGSPPIDAPEQRAAILVRLIAEEENQRG